MCYTYTHANNDTLSKNIKVRFMVFKIEMAM